MLWTLCCLQLPPLIAIIAAGMVRFPPACFCSDNCLRHHYFCMNTIIFSPTMALTWVWESRIFRATYYTNIFKIISISVLDNILMPLHTTRWPSWMKQLSPQCTSLTQEIFLALWINLITSGPLSSTTQLYWI